MQQMLSVLPLMEGKGIWTVANSPYHAQLGVLLAFLVASDTTLGTGHRPLQQHKPAPWHIPLSIQGMLWVKDTFGKEVGRFKGSAG